MVSDNYFRSVSGLPPAPYPDQPPTQLALKQNNSDHLTKLARLEVDSILRTLGQPGMYVDGSTTSNQLPSVAPARSGLQQGTPSRQTAVSTLMGLKEGYNSIRTSEGQATGPGPMKHKPPSAFCPINRPSSSVQVSSSPQVTQTPGMTPLGDPKYTGNDPTQAYSHAHCGPSSDSHYKFKDNPMCATD